MFHFRDTGFLSSSSNEILQAFPSFSGCGEDRNQQPLTKENCVILLQGTKKNNEKRAVLCVLAFIQYIFYELFDLTSIRISIRHHNYISS